MANTDIIKANEIAKIGDGIAKKTRMRTMHKDIRMVIAGNPHMVLDVSSSMAARDIANGKRRIDSLREAARNFQGVPFLSFSHEVFDGRIPDPNGSTAMDLAFIALSSKKGTFDSVLVISDGEPNDALAAITTAKDLEVPVNVVFIGLHRGYGYQFMERLAKETGGQVITADLSNLAASLTAGIRGFLGTGSSGSIISGSSSGGE